MSSKYEKFADLSKSNRILALYINDTCGMNRFAGYKSTPRRRPKLLEMLNAFNYNSAAYYEKMKGHGDTGLRLFRHDKFTDTNELSTISDIMNDTYPNFEYGHIAEDNVNLEEVNFLGEISRDSVDVQCGIVEISLEIQEDMVKDLRYDSADYSENVLDIYQEIQDAIEQDRRNNRTDRDLDSISQDSQFDVDKNSQFLDVKAFRDDIEICREKNPEVDTNRKDEDVEELDSLEISQEIPDDIEDVRKNFLDHESLSHKRHSFKGLLSKPESFNYLYDIDIDDPLSVGSPSADISHLKRVLNNIDGSTDWTDADLGNFELMDNLPMPIDGYFVRRPSTILEENSDIAKTDISSSISTDK